MTPDPQAFAFTPCINKHSWSQLYLNPACISIRRIVRQCWQTSCQQAWQVLAKCGLAEPFAFQSINAFCVHLMQGVYWINKLMKGQQTTLFPVLLWQRVEPTQQHLFLGPRTYCVCWQVRKLSHNMTKQAYYNNAKVCHQMSLSSLRPLVNS